MLKKLLTTKSMLLLVILLAGMNAWGQISIANANAVTQNFDTMGASQTASLPSNWRFGPEGNSSPGWATSGFQTAATQSSNSGTPTAGGRYNFGSSTTERAPGFMTSGSYDSPNAIMAYYRNTNTSTLTKLTISYDAERYRRNTGSAGSIAFAYSTNGTTWTTVSAGAVPATTFPTGSNSYGFPLNSVNTAFEISNLTLAQNADIYLRWVITTGASNAQGIAIDNVSVTATYAATVPTVTTDPVGTVTATTAVLNGKVKANNTTMAPYFDYGTTTSYGSQVTAVTPTSIDGNTETTFTGTANGLTPNTSYNYRAAGSNGTVYNGSNATFITLANVPNAPVVSNATTSELTVALTTATQNSNPAATQYAIQITNNATSAVNYVNASGALVTSAVWQTAAQWATRSVGSLTANTSYSFRVKARNSATTPVETAFSDAGTLSTLPNTAPMLLADAITTFGNVCINTTPADKSFLLLGENLTADVIVNANPQLSGFTFATASTGPFTASLTLTPVGGEIEQTIYVRFTPTAVQSYNGNIIISGGGASSINVAAAGSGINTTPTVDASAVTAIAGTTATLNGNVTVQGCSAVTARGFVYATTTAPEIGGTGVINAPAAAGGTGTYSVNVTDLTGSTLYYVRAYATNSGGTVYGATQRTFTTLCTVPTNVTNVTSSTPASGQITLGWANGSCSDGVIVVAKAASAVTAVPTGNGSAYTAAPAFGNGTAIAPGEFVVYNGTGTGVTVTGLTNGTVYHFTIFTRRGTTWNAGVSKTETAALIYCAAAGTTSEYESIASVSFNGQAHPSSATAYSNFTNITFNATQYLSYPFRITVGGSAYFASQGLVWIDWNQDGDFNDAGEEIELTEFMGAGPYTGTITVPGTALTGTTRMRVRVTDSDSPQAALAPCGTSTYGEVEDYTINVIAGVPPLTAPVATAATNTTASSFVANWEAVTGAASYRLDVYTTAIGAANVNEGFSGGTTAPAGWSYSSIDDTYTTAASSGVAAPSLKFDDINDRVTTPIYVGGATSLSFWIKGQSTGSNTSNIFRVEGFNGSEWVVIENISPLPTVNAGVVKLYNSTSTPVLPAGMQRFRFTYLKDTGNVAFDDVKINYTTITNTPVAGYTDLTVNGTSQLVSGLAAATTYNYVVRAVSPTSANSNIISVITGIVKIWAAGAWNGDGNAPTLIDDAIFNGTYNTLANGNFNAAAITVNNPLTISAGTSVTVNGAVTIGTGSMLVENNANVIQNDNNAVNSGAVTVKRETPSLKRLDYKMWSSPVVGQVMSTFSPATDDTRFYTYNTATNLYNGTANSSAFGTGAGYLIRMPNSIPTVPGYNAGNTATKWMGTFTGVPHNGTILSPVAYHPAETVDNVALPVRGFNAVGNPYMSTISASKFFEANSDKIGGTIYFWRKTNETPVQGQQQTPAYHAFTPGLGGTGSGTDAIQVGQGFIINVTSPAAGNVVFNNGMRVINNDNHSFRMPNAPVAEKHRYWLNLINTTGNSSQTLIGYATNATEGFDNGIDGELLNDGTCMLYTVAAGKDLTIQGRSLPFANTDVVQMGYRANIAGNYKIALDHFDGLFAEGQHVYLKDKVANVVHDLNAGQYTFASATGTFNERFEVVYMPQEALGTDNPVVSAESVVVYKDGNALNINAGTAEITAVAIYDIRGRLLYSNDSINATATSVTTLQASQQVLVVQVTTAQNGRITKKVIF